MCVLGTNRRDLDYVLLGDTRPLYFAANNKLRTKEILVGHDIPFPPTYLTINPSCPRGPLWEHLFRLPKSVIKPGRGFRGSGVLLLVERAQNRWKTIDGQWLGWDDISLHVQNIFDGVHSIAHQPDNVFVEYYVDSQIFLSPQKGAAPFDVRLVVYRGIPIMGMLRVVTDRSGGRGNLHRGALGLKIDLLSGRAIFPQENQEILIPSWETMVKIAIKTYQAVPLTYFGIDIMMDKTFGPVVMEINARPGLGIQSVNSDGLWARIKALDALGHRPEQADLDGRFEIFSRLTRILYGAG